MKEIQGKSILVRVIGSRLSLKDFARVLKIKDTAESFILLLAGFYQQKGSAVIYTEGG